MLLFPSLNCANFDYLRDEVVALERAHVDGFHVDISDGTLFPALAMGMCDFLSVRRSTALPVDVHLYMSNPSRFIDAFANAGADIIYVFPESEPFIAFALNRIRNLGKHPGLAVGWGTSFSAVAELLPLVDYVMVNSAIANLERGELSPGIYDKLRDFAECKHSHSFKLLIDGAVTFEVVERATKVGVDGFAMGSGCLFGCGRNYGDTVSRLRSIENG